MAEFFLEEKKSKFFSFLFPVSTENEISKILEMIRTQNKKATHVCFSYIIDDNGRKEKAFDDGEPSGTAGRPILSVLQKQNLENLLLVVVRYFGGTKLGAGGLVRAYTKSASEVVKKAKMEKMI